MKIIASILIYFAVTFSLYGQIVMQSKTVKYIIDDANYHVITFSLCNKFSDSTIIWLSKEDVSNLNEAQKIKSYFLKIKEDFSLLNLITEQQIKKTDTPIVFKTLLKILAPNEVFKIDIICKKNNDTKSLIDVNSFMKKHFVGIEMKKISFISNIKQNNYPFYTNDSLVLIDQMFCK